MVYYEIKLYTNKNDSWGVFPLEGGLRAMKWLKFNGDDNDLQFGEERIDEYLATKILLQNRQEVETTLLVTNDPTLIDHVGETTRFVEYEDQIIELLHGNYEKVIVTKYESSLRIS